MVKKKRGNIETKHKTSTARGTLMEVMQKRVPAFFYRTQAGNEPVRDAIKAESAEDQKRIGEAIKEVEFGWPIGMPTCRPMGDGLHEVRIDLSGNRIARVFFYIDRSQRMVLLHSIVKKTQSTPKTDLALARLNKRSHEGRSNE